MAAGPDTPKGQSERLGSPSNKGAGQSAVDSLNPVGNEPGAGTASEADPMLELTNSVDKPGGPFSGSPLVNVADRVLTPLPTDDLPSEGLLPSQQYIYPGVPPLSEEVLYRRREGVFLIFAGLFLGTLAMLNIVGITRFVDLSLAIPGTNREIPMVVAIGVLPYPVTFLCTDFISELYGRRRASLLVWIGLLLNVWVMAILWLGGRLPGFPSPVFDELRTLAFGAVTASMVAYFTAQFVDVQVFHFLKRVTKGKKLWLRNNGSTLVSQLVDTIAVILITHFYAGALPIAPDQSQVSQLLSFIAAGYTFKLLVALVDTIPFYVGARILSRYLRLAPPGEAYSVA